MYSLNMHNINQRIAWHSSRGEAQHKFLNAVIQEYKNSETYKMAVDAQLYYQNKNTAINSRHREVLSSNDKGIAVRTVDSTLTNYKIPHPFFREFVDEKTAFLSGKPMSINAESDKYSDALNDLAYNLQLNKRVLELTRNALIEGIAWLQVYYNEQGKLSIRINKSTEIIPIWEDADKTILSALIRFYDFEDYGTDGKSCKTTHVEYYDNMGVWHYIFKDSTVMPNPAYYGNNSTAMPMPHFTVGEQGLVFERVPFIPFRYGHDEISLLQLVKGFIDAFDFIVADIANSVGDMAFALWVVRGYKSEDEAGKMKARRSFAKTKMAFVAQDGGIDVLQPKIDMQVLDSVLDRLDKNMRSSTRVVDDSARSGQASGKALDRLYNKIALDANLMQTEFASGLQDLLWFINNDLYNQGKGDYTKEKVDFIFNTDMPVNELEIVQMLRQSVGLVSQETLTANHPLVTNVAEELERMEKEKQDNLDMYGFGQDNNIDNIDDKGEDEPKE